MKKYKQFLSGYLLDPLDKPKKHQYLLLIFSALVLVCAAVCLGMCSLYFGALYLNMDRFWSYFTSPMLIFLNMLPVVILALVFPFSSPPLWCLWAPLSITLR